MDVQGSVRAPTDNGPYTFIKFRGARDVESSEEPPALSKREPRNCRQMEPHLELFVEAPDEVNMFDEVLFEGTFRSPKDIGDLMFEQGAHEDSAWLYKDPMQLVESVLPTASSSKL